MTFNASQEQWIFQMFISKIFQIKMFILAIENNVDKYMIFKNLGISIFQQKIYENLYLHPKNILSSNNKILKIMSHWNGNKKE